MHWIKQRNQKTKNVLNEGGPEINWVRGCIHLVALLGAFLGFSLIALYCFYLSFLPQDISVNDIFVLLLVSVAFGFVYISGLVYSVISWVAAFKFSNFLVQTVCKKTRQPTSRLNYIPLPISLLAFVILGVLCVGLFIRESESAQDGLQIILTFWVGGFFVSLSLFEKMSEEPPPQRIVRSKMAMILFWVEERLGGSIEARFFLFSVVLPFFYMWTVLLSFVMQLAGIHSPRVAVVLNEENFKYVVSIGKLVGVELKSCPVSDSKSVLVWPVDVLWHGIGSVSQLRIALPKKSDLNETQYITVGLDNKGVIPVKSNGQVNPRCTQ